MTKRLSITMIAVVLVGMASCEKILLEPDGFSSDPFENFDYLWNEADEKYAFFDHKGIDWEAQRTFYRAKLYQGMSQDSLFKVLTEILNQLQDGHVNLVSGFNVSRFFIERLGRDNYDQRIVEENYLNYDFYTTGPFRHSFLEGGQIGYIRFAAFTGSVSANQLDFMLQRYAQTEGLILDIRENGGGSLRDVYRILERFASGHTHIFSSQSKGGPAHDDFMEIAPVYLDPSGKNTFLNRVIILTDRSTYSAGSFLALGAKQLSNLTLMGDTTGGGLGIPNGGQLPNGWIYRFSVTRTLAVDGSNYENGVPPDIHVIYTDADWAEGIDTILEAAIAEIL